MVRIYARPGLKLAGQLSGDIFLLLWLVAWAFAGRALRHAVEQLAIPARQSANLAEQMSQQMRDAHDQVAQVPGVGDRLAGPFGSLSGGLQQMVDQANQQVDNIHHVALLAGIVCFAIPSLVMLWRWLPRRWRFISQARATRTLIDGDEDLDLFALRAMANLPMEQLAKVSSDPVGDWRRGDREVVRQLAALELRRTGLDLPAPVRRPGR